MRDFRVKWDASRAVDAVQTGRVRGSVQAANELLAAANENVPVDTGALKASGEVSVNEETGEATVSYNTEYAVLVHEDQERSHANGTAKWLQRAFDENPDLVLEAYGQALKEALG